MTLGYEDISAWSIIALNNGNSDSAINWLEHQPRASVNNSARSVMAALAKNRDMQNGSIVTGGIANAQTATTPVGFGGVTIPIGTRMRVKVGSGLTNTATGLTLQVDGGAISGVLNLRGQSPAPGEWQAGSYIDLVFDGTYWNMATALPGVFTPDNMNHGRFSLSSATQCQFLPFMGSQIKVNGIVYSIPSNGVAFPNTSVNVGGTTGANLGPNTLYYAGLNVIGGVLTPYYGTSHTTSSTVGNVGTEIVDNNDAVSLVGIVRTNASSQFVDAAAQRFVRSWFNRQRTSVQGASQNVTGFSSSGATGPYWTSAAFVCFADDAVVASVPGFNDANSPDALYAWVNIDGSNQGQACYTFPQGPSQWQSFTPIVTLHVADGYHYASLGTGTGFAVGHSIYWTPIATIG